MSQPLIYQRVRLCANRFWSDLVSVYYILTRRMLYRELGSLHFDERDRKQVEQRLVRRLERLGYSVNLQPLAA